MEIDIIESAFAHSIEIEFCQSPFDGTPDWIALSIEDGFVTIVIEAFNLMASKFAGQKCIMLIYPKEDKFDVSIVNEITADIVNIKSLYYEVDNSRQFIKIIEGARVDLRMYIAGACIAGQNSRPYFNLDAVRMVD